MDVGRYVDSKKFSGPQLASNNLAGYGLQHFNCIPVPQMISKEYAKRLQGTYLCQAPHPYLTPSIGATHASHAGTGIRLSIIQRASRANSITVSGLITGITAPL